MSFPKTRYMGSKQSLLPFILKHLKHIEFDTAMDAFSGTGCVGYVLKEMGKRVVANDFHSFAHNLAIATIENNRQKLSPQNVSLLLSKNPQAGSFVRKRYSDLYFSEHDCEFLDNTYANMLLLPGKLKKSLAISALCRACMKKRPRGIFTFVGKKGWDGRRDLKLTMQDQFLEAVAILNASVFSNGRRNRATCLDVFLTAPKNIDLVYLDPPYVSRHSDCDYTRRYHFIEGLCTYWKDVEIQEETKTKKIKSYPTAFKSANSIREAFLRLFEHFKESKIVVSYGSNGIPDRQEMVRTLKLFKKHVCVKEISHKYSHGNHSHKVGQNNNSVKEYLFIAV